MLVNIVTTIRKADATVKDSKTATA
jgi:hypothetical protein